MHKARKCKKVSILIYLCSLYRLLAVETQNGYKCPIGNKLIILTYVETPELLMLSCLLFSGPFNFSSLRPPHITHLST